MNSYYVGQETKNKTTFKIIMWSIGIAIVLIGFLIYRFSVLREIVIKDTEIQLLPGNTYTIEYTTKPKTRINDKIVWTSNNDNAISVNNGVITAIAEGEAKVWAKSKQHPDIYTTVDVVVKSRTTRFKDKLKKTFDYKEESKNYLKKGKDNIFDINNHVFIIIQYNTTYTYYYKEGYIAAVTTNSYDSTHYRYDVNSGTLNCSSAYESSCYESFLTSVRDQMELMRDTLKDYLGREYTIEDI